MENFSSRTVGIYREFESSTLSTVFLKLFVSINIEKLLKPYIGEVMNNKFKYDLYKIGWEDICSDSGWASDVEFNQMDVSHCISIGFIYKKTKDYIWIFSSYEIDNLGEITYGDRTVIPLNNVKTMEKING